MLIALLNKSKKKILLKNVIMNTLKEILQASTNEKNITAQQ